MAREHRRNIVWLTKNAHAKCNHKHIDSRERCLRSPHFEVSKCMLPITSMNMATDVDSVK